MKTLQDYILENQTINESLPLVAFASGIIIKNALGFSYEKNSKEAKTINELIRICLLVGGMFLSKMSNDAVVAISFIILTTACAGNFNLKDLIDSKLSKNESLEDQEVIEESKINDFFRNKINQILTKNEKLKNMCDEIMERDDFKEAQKENSIKQLVKCVVSYFKEKKNSEGELMKIHQNILA